MVLCSCRTLIFGSAGLFWTSGRSSGLLEPCFIFYCFSLFAYVSASMKNSSFCLMESLFLTWKPKSTGCTDFRKLLGSWRFSGNLCIPNILEGDAPRLLIELRYLTGLKLGAYWRGLLIILLLALFWLFGLYSLGTPPPPEPTCTLFSFLFSASSLYGEPALLLLASSSELKFLLVLLNRLCGFGMLWWIMLLCLLLGLNSI